MADLETKETQQPTGNRPGRPKTRVQPWRPDNSLGITLFLPVTEYELLRQIAQRSMRNVRSEATYRLRQSLKMET
jgi:hypothetical protein